MKFIKIMLFLLILSQSFPMKIIAGSMGKTEAEPIISEAERSLETAYLILLEAESADIGIQRTQALVEQFNSALSDQSEAQKLMNLGEYDSASIKAEKVIENTQKIIEDATTLKEAAKLEKEFEFRRQLLISTTLSFLIIIIGFRSWILFKDYYVKRMKGLKPVVDKSEPR